MLSAAFTVLKRDTEYEETGVLYVGTEAQPVEIPTAGGSSGNYDYRQCRELAPGDEVTFLARVPRPVATRSALCRLHF